MAALLASASKPRKLAAGGDAPASRDIVEPGDSGTPLSPLTETTDLRNTKAVVPGTLIRSAIAQFHGQRAGHDRAGGGHYATASCFLARVVLQLCHWLALQSIR